MSIFLYDKSNKYFMTKVARINYINSINNLYSVTESINIKKKTFNTKEIIVNIITLKYFFLGLVYFYKLVISPLLPHSCLFKPTCSSYMIMSINKHGIFWGTLMGIERLLRCNPFNTGGIDPVADSIGETKWLY